VVLTGRCFGKDSEHPISWVPGLPFTQSAEHIQRHSRGSHGENLEKIFVESTFLALQNEMQRQTCNIIPCMAIKQPNSRMCFICGLENPVGLHLHIYETEPGAVETTYIAPEHFQGYPGVLHGGIVGAIIDEISGRALMGSDPLTPRFMFTARLEVKYRRNVPIGKPLKIVGRAGRTKSRSAEAWAGIYDAGTNELLAEGTTVLMNVPAGQIDPSDLEELGWKVYPE
jgi:acyl-coenzyme A thioesterase PaaI-like protein